MSEVVANHLRIPLGLGEDEGALQNGLNEGSDAFGGPGQVGCVEVFRGLDVAGERGDVRLERLFAGFADIGMSGVGLLDQGAEQASVVSEFAGEDGRAEVQVAEQASKWICGS